jgi:hypothetical protein
VLAEQRAGTAALAMRASWMLLLDFRSFDIRKYKKTKHKIEFNFWFQLWVRSMTRATDRVRHRQVIAVLLTISLSTLIVMCVVISLSE